MFLIIWLKIFQNVLYDICGKCYRNIHGNNISNFASMQNREDLRAIQKINKNNCTDNVKHIFLMRVEYYRVFKAQKYSV